MRIQYFGQTPGRRTADRCAQFSWRDAEEKHAYEVLETLEGQGWPIDWTGVGDDDWTAVYCSVSNKEEYEDLKADYKKANASK